MSKYPDDGELSIEADGVIVSGWQAIRLTRGVERCPSDFDIALTEKFPGSSKDVAIKPGDVCRVKIGKDLVLTGYVDRVLPSIVAEGHQLRIMGRGACEDISDCSVDYRGPVFNAQSARGIIEALCKPYGVTVRALAGEGLTIPQLVINLGETPYQVAERLARYNAWLAYEDVEGNLILARVGTESMGSGFKEGLNVLEATGEFSLDQRFNEYHAYMLSVDSFADMRTASTVDGNQKGVATDAGMAGLKRPDGQPRVRQLAIISEQTDQLGSVAVRRADWEMKRRAGRSQAIRVTADSWRDAKGKLWEPNYRAKVDIPHCKTSGVEYVVGEVTYLRDDRGTRASLVLMPPEAYSPEPTPLNLFDSQIRQDLDGGTGQGQLPGDVAPPSSDHGQG